VNGELNPIRKEGLGSDPAVSEELGGEKKKKAKEMCDAASQDMAHGAWGILRVNTLSY